jgi:hypothetical protein
MRVHAPLICANHDLNSKAIIVAAIACLVALVLGIAMAVVLWLPAAYFDDQAFCGPAIYFAATGEMKSFLFDFGWAAKITDKPFWYTPIHFYALGYWLKIFGISTASALCYYATAAAVSAAGVSLMLARFGCTPLWCLGGALLSWTTFYSAMQYSLRPEPLGLAFLLIGLPLIPSSRCVLQSVSFFLVSLAVITAPRLAVWAAPFMVLFALPILSDLRSVARNATIGLALALIVFSISIGFDFKSFFDVFLHHAVLRTHRLLIAHKIFIRLMTTGWAKVTWLGVLVVLMIGALASWCFGYWRVAWPLLLAFACGFFVSNVNGAEASATVLFIYIVAMAVWGGPQSGPNSFSLRIAAFSAAGLCAGIPLIAISTMFFNARYNDPDLWAGYRAIRKIVKAERPPSIMIDEASLRFVFDMDPPLTATWVGAGVRAVRSKESGAAPPLAGRDFVIGHRWLSNVLTTKFPHRYSIETVSPRKTQVLGVGFSGPATLGGGKPSYKILYNSRTPIAAKPPELVTASPSEP